MHLQNQAFDIDKYRNLFEKEVTKKYGISSINISQDSSEPIKYLDIEMGKPHEHTPQSKDKDIASSKDGGTTNRRTSTGSIMKNSTIGK